MLPRFDRVTARRLKLMARRRPSLRAVQPRSAPTKHPKPPSPRLVAFQRFLRTAAPDLIEMSFVIIGDIGVAAFSWPAALIVFGTLGVIACERRSAATQRGSKGAAGGYERVA